MSGGNYRKTDHVVATPAEVTDIDGIVRAAKMMQAQCDGVDRWQRLSADVRAQWIESVLPIATALADRPATAEVMENAETVARKFHEAYESLAPSFGYETRRETREFDPASPNGRLMIAVCAALAAQPSAVGVPGEITPKDVIERHMANTRWGMAGAITFAKGWNECRKAMLAAPETPHD